uniref:Uncharacterized protein n=1 Tax=Arundo donax TaxID=35708 RepID=A0A0A9RC02_ARUDO
MTSHRQKLYRIAGDRNQTQQAGTVRTIKSQTIFTSSRPPWGEVGG